MSLIITLDKGISIDSGLKDKLQSIVSLIFREEGLVNSEINLRILDDEEMKKLNHKFRNKNLTTNVLSFQSDDISIKHTKNIGDIAISSEYVEREAVEEGKFFEDHMIHMLAHGVYHILGYDHQNEETALIMENKEINILNKININNPY
ncbi:rRNA maturation RNase YbeY [Gammaproteobacteria bacterium]|nr:rRNA maturation RNase YbeY [Gammaproteobacteria bacterium]MDC0420759.1 rRNA maturation RNase YbeY [Gammaproteobacteria bacterium]MDC0536458.1 rRNA maturation RNase YbeY [Gammaproteobacteria bacterium]MDC1149060.1 rRNA maturation RNase YbeY [Gammaproteobacteria bacterium]MDC1170827.1 rRNA maturation RNase YbeY [Gammaproteobacteria bacterium]